MVIQVHHWQPSREVTQTYQSYQSDVKGPGGSMDNHNDEELYGEAVRPGPVSEPKDRADATIESDGSTVDVEGHRKVLDGPWLRRRPVRMADHPARRRAPPRYRPHEPVGQSITRTHGGERRAWPTRYARRAVSVWCRSEPAWVRADRGRRALYVLLSQASWGNT